MINYVPSSTCWLANGIWGNPGNRIVNVWLKIAFDMIQVLAAAFTAGGVYRDSPVEELDGGKASRSSSGRMEPQASNESACGGPLLTHSPQSGRSEHDSNSLIKPDGCVIGELDDFDGRMYRWNPPSDLKPRCAYSLMLIVQLALWTALWMFALWRLWHNPAISLQILPGMALGWAIGASRPGFKLFRLLCPRHPESVVLGDHVSHYDSGTASSYLATKPGPARNLSARLARARRFMACDIPFAPRKRFRIDKEELGALVLDRVDDHQGLYLDHGDDRVEIGKSLREPDREWLAAVIDAWRTK